MTVSSVYVCVCLLLGKQYFLNRVRASVCACASKEQCPFSAGHFLVVEKPLWGDTDDWREHTYGAVDNYKNAEEKIHFPEQLKCNSFFFWGLCCAAVRAGSSKVLFGPETLTKSENTTYCVCKQGQQTELIIEGQRKWPAACEGSFPRCHIQNVPSLN